MDLLIISVVAASIACTYLIARHTALSLRVALLALAWVLMFLSLTQPGFNGLSILGVIAAVSSIALFVCAPSKKESRP